MKRSIRQLLVFACLGLATGWPCVIPAAPSITPSLAHLEEQRRVLLSDTRQLTVSVREAIQLTAQRERNRLKGVIGELLGDFSRGRFAQAEQDALWVHMAAGGSPDLMMGYFGAASNVISRVEPGHSLRDEFGIRYNSELEKAQEVIGFRRSLEEKVSVAYLDHLVMADAAQGLSGFRRYTRTLRHHQVAEQLRAEADGINLEAEQQLAQDVIAGVPLVGEALDIISITTGEAALTGEQLSATQRTLDAIMLLAPEALEAYFKVRPGRVGNLGNLGELSKKIDALEPGALERAATRLGQSAERMKALAQRIKKAAAKGKEAAGEFFGEQVDALRKKLKARKRSQYLADMDGVVGKQLRTVQDSVDMDAYQAWLKAENKGKKAVRDLDHRLGGDVIAKSGDPEVLDLYQDLRKDKRALNELQKPEYQYLREDVQRLEDTLFSHVAGTGGDSRLVMGRVDTDAIDSIRKGFARRPDPDALAALKAKPHSALGPDDLLQLQQETARRKIASRVKAHGQKHGIASGYADQALDFEKLDITVFNATNKPPARGKVGFDRDITYQVEVPARKVETVDPRTGKTVTVDVPATKVDVPADLVEVHYNESLYRNLNPGQPVPSRTDLKKFGEAMDHQVTDALHSDAYRLDVDNITDFFKDPALLAKQGVRVEDFAETVTYKSKEWFKRADEAADAGTSMAYRAEGMRQAAKQQENYMEALVDHYGMSIRKDMSERLQKGMHVFEMVRQNKITVPEADAVLKSMNMSQDEVVERFGAFFSSLVTLNKGTPGPFPGAR